MRPAAAKLGLLETTMEGGPVDLERDRWRSDSSGLVAVETDSGVSLTRDSLVCAAPQPQGTALQDRYAVDRELGSGGMAAIYLARDLRDGSSVAVNVLRPELVEAQRTRLLSASPPTAARRLIGEYSSPHFRRLCGAFRLKTRSQPQDKVLQPSRTLMRQES
jgi:serine/threonine protein kinase